MQKNQVLYEGVNGTYHVLNVLQIRYLTVRRYLTLGQPGSSVESQPSGSSRWQGASLRDFAKNHLSRFCIMVASRGGGGEPKFIGSRVPFRSYRLPNSDCNTGSPSFWASMRRQICFSTRIGQSNNLMRPPQTRSMCALMCVAPKVWEKTYLGCSVAQLFC